MKQKRLAILAVCIVCVVAIVGGVYGIEKNKEADSERVKGGEGTGMFEYPKPEKISISQEGKDTIEIKDEKIIANIVSQCSISWEIANVPQGEHAEIWVDFHNGRAMLGISEDGTYAAIGNSRQTPLEFKMPKALYEYICKEGNIQ